LCCLFLKNVCFFLFSKSWKTRKWRTWLNSSEKEKKTWEKEQERHHGSVIFAQLNLKKVARDPHEANPDSSTLRFICGVLTMSQW